MNKCPSCRLPIGSKRCRAMEKLVESIKVECKNKKFGCTELIAYHMIETKHEETCPYISCFCPLSSCDYVNSSKNLYEHFSNDHASYSTLFTYDTPFYVGVIMSQRHIFLQERNEGVIFILNHDISWEERRFGVDCIGPKSFENAFAYILNATCGETYMSIEDAPYVFTSWQQHIPGMFRLSITSKLPIYIGRISIQVCIRKAPPNFRRHHWPITWIGANSLNDR
ncbi:TRAF-like protein [Artemisia annua]|uniref:TRAF-like protein n=1 Tax=Artemisia annua TaxID=35608 RepID=A0A2U1LEB5_ARTAN|nr:TRAF-like protein [Artemisia annua]